MRINPRLLACVFGLTLGAVQAQTMASRPNPAAAYVATQLEVTMPVAATAPYTPAVSVADGSIRAYLDGGCFASAGCPGGGTLQTFAFTVPELGPGEYDLRMYNGTSAHPGTLVYSSRLNVRAASSYQGLWWGSPAGSESGWGLQISQQGQTLFAVWFTYDAQGRGTWFVMPATRFINHREFSGPMYRVTAMPGPGSIRLAPMSIAEYAGEASFFFGEDGNNGAFLYAMRGDSQTKLITRQVFATPATTCTVEGPPSETNFQDLWWNRPADSEPGWGLQIAHQGDVLFVTAYGYDAEGKPAWMAMPDARPSGPRTYSGRLYRTRGPAYTVFPWPSSQVSVIPIGAATISFEAAEKGTFTYTLDEAPSSPVRKPIVRQLDSPLRSVCR